MRVLGDLIQKYSLSRIRFTLNAIDKMEAIRKAEVLARKYRMKFKALNVKMFSKVIFDISTGASCSRALKGFLFLI